MQPCINNKTATVSRSTQILRHSLWSQIDATAAPSSYVQFLDATRLQTVRAANFNPAKFFDYLHIGLGDYILDIGCGIGDLLHPIAELVGEQGRVIGIDVSRSMIAEARRRAMRIDASVEFQVADVQHLPFQACSFDKCIANAILEHVEEPFRAIEEMARITQIGGTITVTETDWETQVVDAEDRIVTRRILNFCCDSIRHGWVARQLPALFRQAGMTDIKVVSLTSTNMDARLWLDNWLIESALGAQAAGIIDACEASQWLADQEERGQSGHFFGAFTSFRVSGRKKG
jgi:ubiquinone/menaquinone biosynthesis C-methylase UbiE